MIKEARGFGEDIAEAQENARVNLGVAPDADIQYEIISQSKKKVLGLFGGSKAEVRAYIELPDEPQKKVKAPKKERNKSSKKNQDTKPQEKNTSEKVSENTMFDFDNLVAEADLPENDKTRTAINYLRNVLEKMGAGNLEFKAASKDNNAYVQIDGDNMGVVIGRRGETLDALQYLAGLSANDGSGYFKVSLNIGDYRQKREIALTELAGKVANQVLETGRSRALEPMNPYERRVIHTAIQAIDGVVSNSIGEGNSRRVVVYSKNGDMRPPRITNDRRGRGDRRRGRSNGRNSNVVSSEPSREPKKDTDIPLYGKIN